MSAPANKNFQLKILWNIFSHCWASFAIILVTLHCFSFQEWGIFLESFGIFKSIWGHYRVRVFRDCEDSTSFQVMSNSWVWWLCLHAFISRILTCRKALLIFFDMSIVNYSLERYFGYSCVLCQLPQGEIVACTSDLHWGQVWWQLFSSVRGWITLEGKPFPIPSQHYEFHEGNFLAMMAPVGRIIVEIDLFIPILAPSSEHNPT